MKITGFETIRLGEFPNDQVALVTGAARGIGRATARLLAQRCAAVATGSSQVRNGSSAAVDGPSCSVRFSAQSRLWNR